MDGLEWFCQVLREPAAGFLRRKNPRARPGLRADLYGKPVQNQGVELYWNIDKFNP